jgi:hypothetical protein
MKYVILILISLSLFSCSKTKINSYSEKKNNYLVYYFHPTARCESCINIENFTKELLENKYSKDPEITFKPLNIEDKENEHFKKEFNLKFSSVIIVDVKDKSVNRFKLLDSVWSYSDNKERMFKYAEREIEEFIK